MFASSAMQHPRPHLRTIASLTALSLLCPPTLHAAAPAAPAAPVAPAAVAPAAAAAAPAAPSPTPPPAETAAPSITDLMADFEADFTAGQARFDSGAYLDAGALWIAAAASNA